jgi:hypothetical protein
MENDGISDAHFGILSQENTAWQPCFSDFEPKLENRKFGEIWSSQLHWKCNLAYPNFYTFIQSFCFWVQGFLYTFWVLSMSVL